MHEKMTQKHAVSKHCKLTDATIFTHERIKKLDLDWIAKFPIKMLLSIVDWREFATKRKLGPIFRLFDSNNALAFCFNIVQIFLSTFSPLQHWDEEQHNSTDCNRSSSHPESVFVRAKYIIKFPYNIKKSIIHKYTISSWKAPVGGPL